MSTNTSCTMHTAQFYREYNFHVVLVGCTLKIPSIILPN